MAGIFDGLNGGGFSSGFAQGNAVRKQLGLASGVQDYVNAEASGDKAGMQKALGLMAGYAPAETMNWIQSQKKLNGLGGTESAMIIDSMEHPEKYQPSTRDYLQKRAGVLSQDPNVAIANAIAKAQGGIQGKYYGNEWEKGQKGWISVGGESKIIKGSDAEREWLNENSKELENNAITLRGASTVPVDIDRSLKLIEEYPEATQMSGSMMSWAPGTPAYDLKKLIGSVQSQIGIDTLLGIKKSGAGLGQVPQSQLEMLSSILGELNQAQSTPQLVYNLNRVKTLYNDILTKAKESNDRIMSKIYDPNEKQNTQDDPLGIMGE